MTHSTESEQLRSPTDLPSLYIALLKNERLWQTSLAAAMDIVTLHSRIALRVTSASIWIYSSDSKSLCCVAVSQNQPQSPAVATTINACEYPAYFLALEKGRVISANNAATDPRTAELILTDAVTPDVHAMLDATLRREGLTSGVICFEQVGTTRTWSESEINFATSVADLVSQLIMFYSLHNSELRYRTVFDSTGDAVIIIRTNIVSDCNTAALRLFRCNRQQFIGQPITKLWQLDSFNEDYQRFEWQQLRWDNTHFYADVTLTRAKLEQEEHLIASVRDISDKHLAVRQLRDLNSLHQAIFDGTSYCIIATDLNGLIQTFNRAAEYHLRYKASEIIDIATPIIFHSHKELQWRSATLSRELGYELQPNFETLAAKARKGLTDENEWNYQRKDGSEISVSLVVAPLRNNSQQITGFLFMAADITEKKRASELLVDSKREIERRANHDELTGLPNRLRLHDVASITIHNAAKNGNKVALMLLDLNRFKDINDTLGHAIGDQILKEIAKRLQPMLMRHGAYLYRLGGDEFAILITKVDIGGETISLASFIDASLRKPIVSGGISLEIGGSIGIAIYPDHGDNSHELLRCADVAMYSAKSRAQPLAFYDPSLDAHSPRRLMLMAELGNAIRQDNLVLHYQPKIDIKTGDCVGCEALVRWQHPKLGQVPPGEFIPMAEMTDVIKPLSEWVLLNALLQTKKWHEKGIPLKTSINLSARNLIDHDFPTIIERHLINIQFPAQYLEIEITESALISDPERSLHIIKRIHDLGVRFAIDDFGTGYSSMAYLKRLPLSTLKIDRTFVCDMLHDPQDEMIIRSTIGLAHSFGLSVVAEGVEDNETLEQLAKLDCEIAQGYFIAQPLAAADFEKWYNQHNLRKKK